MTNLRERSIIVVILLSIVTCGIYNIFLYFALATEVKNEGIKYGENLTEPIVAFLLTIVTCGIYGFYYVYKQGAILKKIGTVNNVSIVDPILPLLLTLLWGLGILVNAYSASELAKASRANSNIG